MILFSRSKFINIQKITCDQEGRYICCEINEDSNQDNICLCNIYAPNTDSSKYFINIAEILADYSGHKIVIGDYNVVQNVKLDRYGSEFNNKKALDQLEILKEQYYLEDVWRNRNSDTMRFSWRRARPRLQASRIDYALVTRSLEDCTETCLYLNSILTDHSAYYMYVTLNKNERGTGYWKLNSKILDNESYKRRIEDKLDKLLTETSNLPPDERWLKIKKDITVFMKNLARTNAEDTKIAMAQLAERISLFEDCFPLNETDMDLYIKSQADLDNLALEKAKGNIFRSKARWHELGEKHSKYFFNLEKTRFNSKTCSKLLTDSGKVLTSDVDILNEQQQFYKQLYQEEKDIQFNLINQKNIRIDEQQQQMLSQNISKKEVEQAILSMKNEKTPGDDGITTEFYKTMWHKIGDTLHQFITASYEKQYLPPTLTCGILNLIPKAGKDSRYLKNLRPLTMLNVDYKIIEKILAMRLDRVLPTVINRDQTGFMKNRRISTNIRRVLDILQHCKNQEIPAIIFNLDYIKCFDRINFGSIIGSLNYFGVPMYIQNWIKLLYQRFTVRVQNNGKFHTTDRCGTFSTSRRMCFSTIIFTVCRNNCPGS